MGGVGVAKRTREISLVPNRSGTLLNHRLRAVAESIVFPSSLGSRACALPGPCPRSDDWGRLWGG